MCAGVCVPGARQGSRRTVVVVVGVGWVGGGDEASEDNCLRERMHFTLRE